MAEAGSYAFRLAVLAFVLFFSTCRIECKPSDRNHRSNVIGRDDSRIVPPVADDDRQSATFKAKRPTGAKTADSDASSSDGGGADSVSAAPDKRQTHFPSKSRDVVARHGNDGVRVWNDRVDDRIALDVFTDAHVRRWRRMINTSQVVRLDRGCGRLMNRKASFVDGEAVCCRYREKSASVLGEMYSYVLSRLLGMNNVPPTALSMADPRTDQWSLVSDRFEENSWSPDEPHLVSLTQWIDDLSPVTLPEALRYVGKEGDEELSKIGLRELASLAQWTDLIAFDYVTAMRDRLMNMLNSASENPEALNENVPNLEKWGRDGYLVFLDNESGFESGQRFLDSPGAGYLANHEHFLKMTCIFRRETVQKFKELHERGNVGERLWMKLQEIDPLADKLGPLSPHVAAGVQQRIDKVYQHMKECSEGLENTVRTFL